MPVLDLFQGRVEFSPQLLGDNDAEDFDVLMRGHPPRPNLAGALEAAIDGKTASKDEIAAARDLVDSVESVQLHFAPFPLGKFRSHH